jgi:hypothetical protein
VGPAELKNTYPPFGLRIQARSAILRAITDAGPPELFELVAGGVDDAVSMSSCYPWTDSQVHRCGPAWSASSVPA